MASVQLLRLIFLIMLGLTITIVIYIWGSQILQANFVFGNNDISSFNDEVTTIACYEHQANISHQSDNNVPIIYFITPTYPRREQIPELTRLGQTLMHVRRLHWIVADDNAKCNPSLVKLLSKFGIPLTIMATPMPSAFRKRDKTQMPRGVANRRAAISWIQNNAGKGVLYFGDDDNTFDLKLFDEIRYTKKVSMMPVGLIGDFGVSSPVVKEGKVVGFFDSWPAGRKFSIDMAGFAVSVEFLKKSPGVTMPFKVGYEEDMFLRSLGLSLEDIEPVADGCTKILVWHTQTTAKKMSNLQLARTESGTSLDSLLIEMHELGIVSSGHTKGLKTFYTEGKRRIEI